MSAFSFKLQWYTAPNILVYKLAGDKILLGAGGPIDAFWNMYAVHQTPEVLEILHQYRIGNLSKKDQVSLLCRVVEPFVFWTMLFCESYMRSLNFISFAKVHQCKDVQCMVKRRVVGQANDAVCVEGQWRSKLSLIHVAHWLIDPWQKSPLDELQILQRVVFSCLLALMLLLGISAPYCTPALKARNLRPTSHPLQALLLLFTASHGVRLSIFFCNALTSFTTSSVHSPMNGSFQRMLRASVADRRVLINEE